MAKQSVSQWAISLVLFAVSGLLAVVGTAFAVEAHGLAETRQPLFNTLAAVCGPHTIGQSFVATAPNLDGVDLWLAWSPPRQPVEAVVPAALPPASVPAGGVRSIGELEYRLYLPIVVRSPDVPNTQGCNLISRDGNGPIIVSLKPALASSAVIATATLRLNQVENPGTALRRPYVYQSFTFSPIPDSAGHTFYLFVEAPTSSATAPLLARYHQSDIYTEGTYYLDGTPTPGDLAFRVRYSTAPMGDFQLLLRRLAHNRPVPLSWPWLYPLLLAVYVGSLALVIRAIVQNIVRIED